MTASAKTLSIKQVLYAVACTYLMMVFSTPHAGAGECMGSIDLTLNGETVIKGEAPYEAGDQGCGCQGSLTGTVNGDVSDVTLISGCKKTETYHDGNEFRSRTTTINSDGSVNPLGEDTRMVLDKNQWRTDYKDGNYGQFGGEWPDDEYTRSIPRPDMSVAFASVNKKSNSFTAMFDKGTNLSSNVTKMKAYVEKLKARGFTVDAYQSEKPEFKAYAFRAKNSAGDFVRVNCTNATCSLSLKKKNDG